jgi:hypothetical protein
MPDLAEDFSTELLLADQLISDAIEQMEQDIDYSVIGPRVDRFQARAIPSDQALLDFHILPFACLRFWIEEAFALEPVWALLLLLRCY